MIIAILGSGNMGRALGARWAGLGHTVVFAARNRAKAEKAAAEAGPNARAATLDDAAAEADIVFWSPRDRDPSAVLNAPDVLSGKIVIDMANRSMPEVIEGRPFPEPLAAQLSRALPDARIVKAFNTLAMEAFDLDPDALRAAEAELPIAGDDAEAKAAVRALIEPLGYTVRDMGGLESARTLELMADALRLGMGRLGWRVHLAFRPLPETSLGAIGDREASNYS